MERGGATPRGSRSTATKEPKLISHTRSLPFTISVLAPGPPLIMVPLLLSLAALSCLSFAGAEAFHVPLVRKRDYISTVEDWGVAADALRNKYGFPSSSPSKRQNTAAIPVINQVCPSLPHKSPPTLTTIRRTVTPVTWVLSRSGHRVFNTLQLTFSDLPTQILNQSSIFQRRP